MTLGCRPPSSLAANIANLSTLPSGWWTVTPTTSRALVNRLWQLLRMARQHQRELGKQRAPSLQLLTGWQWIHGSGLEFETTHRLCHLSDVPPIVHVTGTLARSLQSVAGAWATREWRERCDIAQRPAVYSIQGRRAYVFFRRPGLCFFRRRLRSQELAGKGENRYRRAL